jgi:hypothetical protein
LYYFCKSPRQHMIVAATDVSSRQKVEIIR